MNYPHHELDQSFSSVQITNYDDSEFMINAYKKKKQQYEKYKKKYIKVESEVFLLQ